jgi:UDP:flavonoid glycosyltransferase YjiC (YdhE family)
MVSTAGRPFPGSSPSHVWMAAYIPGIQAATKADLVICNGGSATVYQALAAGVPILGIQSNLDQYLTMHYVEKCGVGGLVRAGEASEASLTDVARRIVSEPQYRHRAESLKTLVQATHEARAFATFLDRLFASTREPVVVSTSATAGHRTVAGI